MIRIFIFFLILNVSFVNAEVFKWTDEYGVVHYSGSKPSSIEAESIDIKKHNISSYQPPEARNIPDIRMSHTSLKQSQNDNSSGVTQECKEMRHAGYLLKSGIISFEREKAGKYSKRDNVGAYNNLINKFNKLKSQFELTCGKLPGGSKFLNISYKIDHKKVCKAAKIELRKMKDDRAHIIREKINQQERVTKSLCKKK